MGVKYFTIQIYVCRKCRPAVPEDLVMASLEGIVSGWEGVVNV